MPDRLRRWTTWPVMALVLLVLVVAGAIGYALIHERGVKPASFTDTVKNQRILDKLKPYPGSRQTQKFVRRSYGGYGRGLIPGEEVRSHSTTVVYQLPKGAKPKQVTAFYRGQLRGWEGQEDFAGPSCGASDNRQPCFSTFTKEEALVSLTFDRGRKRLMLLVDHQGAGDRYYGGD